MSSSGRVPDRSPPTMSAGSDHLPAASEPGWPRVAKRTQPQAQRPLSAESHGGLEVSRPEFYARVAQVRQLDKQLNSRTGKTTGAFFRVLVREGHLCEEANAGKLFSCQ